VRRLKLCRGDADNNAVELAGKKGRRPDDEGSRRQADDARAAGPHVRPEGARAAPPEQAFEAAALIYQHDPPTRGLLQAVLGECGYKSVLAADREHVQEAFKDAGAPTLAILDLDTPGGDTIEICRRLRNQEHGDYIYVILLAEPHHHTEVIETVKAGADCCITKPIDPDMLRARLQAAQRILDLQAQLIAARESLRQQATSDALTGLANRPAILKTLDLELNRAARQGASVGVIMIDLDGFKRINDSHGHRIGDVALRQAARRMQNAIRPYDGFGRYGGEEFLVVLPECGLTLAGEVAERLCRCVSASPVPVEGKELSVTISAGVAAKAGASGGDADSLIQAADEALYGAKAAGRNCVKASPMFACTHPQ